jgi:hypothetical protein
MWAKCGGQRPDADCSSQALQVGGGVEVQQGLGQLAALAAGEGGDALGHIGCLSAEAAGDLPEQEPGLGVLGAFFAPFGEDLLVEAGLFQVGVRQVEHVFDLCSASSWKVVYQNGFDEVEDVDSCRSIAGGGCELASLRGGLIIVQYDQFRETRAKGVRCGVDEVIEIDPVQVAVDDPVGST